MRLTNILVLMMYLFDIFINLIALNSKTNNIVLRYLSNPKGSFNLQLLRSHLAHQIREITTKNLSVDTDEQPSISADELCDKLIENIKTSLSIDQETINKILEIEIEDEDDFAANLSEALNDLLPEDERLGENGYTNLTIAICLSKAITTIKIAHAPKEKSDHSDVESPKKTETVDAYHGKNLQHTPHITTDQLLLLLQKKNDQLPTYLPLDFIMCIVALFIKFTEYAKSSSIQDPQKTDNSSKSTPSSSNHWYNFFPEAAAAITTFFRQAEKTAKASNNYQATTSL